MRYQYGGRTSQNKAALLRQKDADVLRENKRWRGAMYVLGYAVECTLKARLMEKYNARTLGDLEKILKKRFKGETIDLKIHSIEHLFFLTGVRDRLEAKGKNDANLRAYRQCNQWNVSWRYDPDGGNRDKCDFFFENVATFLKFLSHSL